MNRAILDRADLTAFRKRPSARLIIGVSLITLSSLMGWPAVAIAGLLAIDQGNAWIFLIGGPTMYAASWVIWGLGLLIAGRDALRYANLFARWLVRVLVEALLGKEETKALIARSEPGRTDENAT